MLPGRRNAAGTLLLFLARRLAIFLFVGVNHLQSLYRQVNRHFHLNRFVPWSISDTHSWLGSNRLATSPLLDVPRLRYTMPACPEGKTPNIHCKCCQKTHCTKCADLGVVSDLGTVPNRRRRTRHRHRCTAAATWPHNRRGEARTR
jgi:hypothetical protein